MRGETMSGTGITRTPLHFTSKVMPKLGTEEESSSSVSVVIRYRLYGRGFIPVRSSPFITAMVWPRGEFRPRQTRQLPRAVDLKGRLLSCQSY